MRFEFATAGRIVFGPGTFRETAPLAREYGSRAFVVTGRNPKRAEPLLEALDAQKMEAVLFCVSGEPTVDGVAEGRRIAREEKCDLVIGIGGGSPLDAGKAVAILLANEGDATDYLETVGKGHAFARPSVPFIAVPTTSGTGSEVTRNAVLASPEHRVKASLRSPFMLPRAAVVDPELTHGLPPDVTAASGMDALTQLIEAHVGCRANPVTDAVCVEGIRRAARSLGTAFREGHNAAAREDMSLASLLGGLALANAGLGAVHGFAGPLGGMLSAPHGALCAALLPHVMEANIAAIRRGGGSLLRYESAARLLTGNPHAGAEDGTAWVRQLARDLNIRNLSSLGLKPADIPEAVEKAAKAGSMKSNPAALAPEELKDILERALQD